ncbi:hypothetical protein EV143_104384 [Flavobacterium chryseum]|uniref:hypothetical protein n=1 Tax=Flavobacterium sp. P3160 TaxID=2512113 RepID=UPI0010EAE0F8|nr:hypothetical protein [Flavobacterium sp. P3160]TDO77617.1 hypothetical protein EV143_104384 [Flavobacterium sp. P3160]
MNKIIYITIGALIIGGIAYYFQNKKKANNNPESKKNIIKNFQQDKELDKSENNLSYSEKLNKTKILYPFKNWRENFFEYGMEQYTEENCNAAKNIFDNLITELIELGENGNKKDKEKCFELAVKSLNKLNEKEESIIETGEREDLCELIDQITIASGLNPEEYAKGEGISDLWREW